MAIATISIRAQRAWSDGARQADDTGVSWYSNNDYANAGTRTGSQPGAGSGTVIDADPRIISNLIVDQTLDNPAAIAAALTHAGMSGQPLMAALADRDRATPGLKAIPAPPSDSSLPPPIPLPRRCSMPSSRNGVEMDGNTVCHPQRLARRRPVLALQRLDHDLRPVLRPRPRPRAKGGNGTVYIPLSPDDPLYRPGAQNYIPLTRVTVNRS